MGAPYAGPTTLSSPEHQVGSPCPEPSLTREPFLTSWKSPACLGGQPSKNNSPTACCPPRAVFPRAVSLANTAALGQTGRERT